MALPKVQSSISAAEAKKTMKAMKYKRVSTIARGRFAKALVFRGSRQKTTGGLTQDMLVRNKRGKIVSKRASAHGARCFKQVEGWLEAVMSARGSLHTQGFVAINGKTSQGKALYAKSKALYSKISVSGTDPSLPKLE